jgi:hypothetical protein
VNEGKRGAGAGAKASEDMKVGDAPYARVQHALLDPPVPRP